MFRGQQVSEVMTQIKEQYGDDAFIVSMTESPEQVQIEVGIDDGLPPLSNGECILEETLVESTRSLDIPQKGRANKKVQNVLLQLEDLMLEHGISNKNAKKIAALSKNSLKEISSSDKHIAFGMEQLIECNSLLPWKSKVVAMCGATGVGKTTTIAKLAARLKASFDISIGLIAADSYRVGAGYHLQTYASLLNLPFRQIESTGNKHATELKKAVDDFKKYDLVLIDTSGCGPRESGRIEELSTSLKLIPEAEKILVLPAPSNDKDLHAAAKSFEKVNYSRIILTKVDESGFIGPAINTLIELDKPLAFITGGQRVPEDIEPASNRRLAWMLTREFH
jgi:flagellar biosynthesis protein FlhF